MKKSILIRAVSFLLIAAVMLTAYGCKDNKKPTGLNQPTIVDNQAVIEYPSVDSNGKDVDATNVVNVDSEYVGQLNAGSSLEDTFKNEDAKDKFVNNSGSLGIDKDKAEEIVDDAAKWRKFSYNIYVANSNEKRVAFRSLRVKNTDDIIIDSDLGCEYGFNPGKGMMIYIEGLVNSTKYETEEEIVAALNEMEVDIIYTFIDSDLDSVDDWSKVTTAYMPVEF
ncbi:MAG: hypothetical protein IKT61_00230 [Clostridia bacterium]|nr:hypothetical protein [Clostridia bacterium]